MKPLLIGLAVIAILSLLWIGAESHYQSCVAMNQQRVLEAGPRVGLPPWKQGTAPPALSDCSRLP